MTAPTLTGRVVYPDDPAYFDARHDYNFRFNIFPRVIVFCQVVEDVVNAVEWATFYGVSIAMRSGRHDYEGFSLVHDGIVIDVSALNTVTYDAGTETATIGAGAGLLHIYEELWKSGVTIPGGTCPTVGIAGLTLGGGFGLVSRLWGLTCDALLEVQMVLASGDVVTASASNLPDLFWACRGGGGGNFGIATSFTFSTQPVSNVSIYNIVWPWGAGTPVPAVFQAWQAWAPYTDDRLVSVLQLFSRIKGSIASIGQFVGPPDELKQILQPLIAAFQPTSVDIKQVSYIDAVYHFAGVKPQHEHWAAHVQPQHQSFKNTSGYAKVPLAADSDGIQVMMNFLEFTGNPTAVVGLDAYGGAVNRVPSDATAFPHRAGTLYSLQFQAYWTADDQAPSNIAWVRTFRRAMQPYLANAAYRNYDDSDIQNWQWAYYQNNFARLMQIKRAYDKDNIFQFPQSIPVG